MEFNKSNFKIKNLSDFRKSEEKDENDKAQNDSESIFDILANNPSSATNYLSEKDISEISSVLDEQKDKTIEMIIPNYNLPSCRTACLLT